MGPDHSDLTLHTSSEEGVSKKPPIIFSGNDSSVWTKWAEEIEHRLDGYGEKIQYELWKWEANDDIIDQEVLDRKRTTDIVDEFYCSKVEKLSPAGRIDG